MCYGTHLCAWPAPCPKLTVIAPAAPFAHYDQLVAQALSTTDLVFAKIETASEKIWQLLNKQRVESKRGGDASPPSPTTGPCLTTIPVG